MTCFSVWNEKNSILVLEYRNRLDIRVGIEIDLISVMGSKLSWFLCAGSKLIRLQCGNRN